MKRTSVENFLEARANELKDNEYCRERIVQDSLIALKFADNHFHFSLPAETPVAQFVEELSALEGISLEKPSAPKEQKPLIFKNRQAIGDILMMTAGVRDFKRTFPDWPANVSSTALHIWDNNPYLDRTLNTSNATLVEIGPGFLTNASNRDDRHFANAFRISIEKALGVQIEQGPIKPDIWMTEKEVSSPPIIEPPYWIIVAGEKGDWTAKTYPFRRWQEFVESFPEVKFVQIGAREHKHPSLGMKNVVNLIGETQSKESGIRDLFRLFYFAEGSLGLVSFQMHLAAAFDMPCVVVAGAREPARFTRYPGHQYLCTDGCLPCSALKACWHCDLEKTCPAIIADPITNQKYPKCVDIITTEDLRRAFLQYYEGGRLSSSFPRTPTLPNGLIHSDDPNSTKKVFSMIKAEDLIKKEIQEKKEVKEKKDLDELSEFLPSQWGFEWGAAMITDQDWAFILSVIKRHEVKTVLEFGSGLSTALFEKLNLDSIISYETLEEWSVSLKRKGIGEKAALRIWNGTVMQDSLPEFDFAFVDGPAGGKTRELATKIAAEKAKIVIIHDAGREWEKKWQEKYLQGIFTGPGKGGHRCHLWIKGEGEGEGEGEEGRNLEEIEKPERKTCEFAPASIEISSGEKLLRLLFNGRGEGGAERSTTWIMNRFIELGWRVEYVYPGQNPSGTFRKHGNTNIKPIGSLDALRRPCDVLLLYTNDWVWDFKQEPVILALESSVAVRKVMAVNFRLGEIGKIPWTQDWDNYLFLNSSLRQAFLIQNHKAKTDSQFFTVRSKVLPPPTDLSGFYGTEINYSGGMKIVRHSSQGDGKYAKDFNEKVEAILSALPTASIHLMPAPTFLTPRERLFSYKRNNPPVKEFLSFGNVFWYDLPDGYHDQGPKVIMEAQASGLPVIAVNHSGPKDRVIKGTGILYGDLESLVEAFGVYDSEYHRKKSGNLAREHAIAEYNPTNWINEIAGEKIDG